MKLSPQASSHFAVKLSEESDKVNVKENDGIEYVNDGITTGSDSTNRYKEKIDIEGKNCGEEVLIVNPGINKCGNLHSSTGNIKDGLEEDGFKVHDHLGFGLVWDESPFAVGKQCNVRTVDTKEQRRTVNTKEVTVEQHVKDKKGKKNEHNQTMIPTCIFVFSY